VPQPPVLNNLFAWYDSSAVSGLGDGQPDDGSLLSLWVDLSGNDRDIVQATAANQPLFRTASPNLLTYNQGATGEDGAATGFGANDRVTAGSLIAGTSSPSPEYGAYRVEWQTDTGTGQSGILTSGTGTAGIPVTGGATYTLFASMRTDSTSSRTARVSLRGWKSDGTNPATLTTSSISATINNTGWTVLTGTVTLPSDWAFVSFRPDCSNPSTGEKFYLDKCGIFAGTVTSWVPPVTLLNGRPCVQLDGYRAALSLNATIARPSTIYIVRVDNARLASGTRYIMDSSAAGVIQPISATNLDRIGAGGSASGTATAVGSGSVSVYDFNSTAMRVYVNGIAGAAGGGATSDFNRINIGSNTVGGSGCSSVSAVLIYSATHDDTTRQSVQNYLGERYGITVV